MILLTLEIVFPALKSKAGFAISFGIETTKEIAEFTHTKETKLSLNLKDHCWKKARRRLFVTTKQFQYCTKF